MVEKSEKLLVEAAMSGDIDSFGCLCKRYYGALVSIGYSVLGDHGLAEDAAQEAIARAIVRIRTLENKCKFGAWIVAICRNVARDMLRARKARQINVADFDNAEVKNPGEKTDAIGRAIARLGETDREVIMLRYYQDLSHESIAAVLGTSRAAVNGRLTRAKRKIAKLLKREGFREGEL